jgi:phosphoesterase RecJ-like protein
MKTHPGIVEKILDEIGRSKTICVAGHVRPDGDCIGSQLGLALALQDQGKKVVCWNEDRVPQKLAFLDPRNLIQPPSHGHRFDCVVATDSASFDRLGKVGKCVQNRKLLVNIDHHASNTRYGELNWVSAREPSTGELVFRLLKAAHWPVTSPIADCLFTAVSTDTGSFQYPSTRPSTYHVAAELVKLANSFASDVWIRKDEVEVSGKSIMGVMMLAAECGSTVEIRARGDDSQAAVDALAQLVLNRFGED